MAYERYANNATTTLTSGVNNSSNPVTVSVASVALFPASGNFRILIDSEILLVTAVSGSDFTATRAQEGTTIATHSTGAAVKLIMTAAAVDQTIKDRFVVDVANNYAAANAALFQANDCGIAVLNQAYMMHSPYIPIRTWDPNSYTWFAQGSASFVKHNDFATTLTIPFTSGEQLRGLAIATSGSFSIDAWIFPVLPLTSGSFTISGINIGNGSDDKKVRLALMNNGSSAWTVLMQNMSSNTAVSTGVCNFNIGYHIPACLRLVYSSGSNNISGYLSYDGINFFKCGVQSSISSSFTPTRGGIHVEYASGSGLDDPKTLFTNVWIR